MCESSWINAQLMANQVMCQYILFPSFIYQPLSLFHLFTWVKLFCFHVLSAQIHHLFSALCLSFYFPKQTGKFKYLFLFRKKNFYYTPWTEDLVLILAQWDFWGKVSKIKWLPTKVDLWSRSTGRKSFYMWVDLDFSFFHSTLFWSVDDWTFGFSSGSEVFH